MSRNVDDLRVRRTRKLLREALIALIEERHFDDLTVSEIARRAMVSRAAFYRYYHDKYELVESIFEDMVAAVTRELDPLRDTVIDRFNAQRATAPWTALFEPAPEARPTPEPYVKLFEHFAHYSRLYRALLGRRGSAWFVTTMRASLTETMSERLRSLAYALGSEQLAESRVFADGFLPAVLAGQLVDAIIWWLEQDRPYAPGQIATCCYRLMCSTLRDAPTWACPSSDT